MKGNHVVHLAGVVALAVCLTVNTAMGQTVLTCGSIVSGSTGGDNQVPYYVDVEAGDHVIFYLLTTSHGTSNNFVATAEVYGPSDLSKPIAKTTANHVGSISVNPAPETGRYTVIVRDSSSEYTGSYHLSVYWWAPVAKRLWRSNLYCGASFSDTDFGRTEIQLHRFWGRKDSKVRLTVQTTNHGPSNNFTAFARVYAPDLYTNLFEGTANHSFTQILTLPEEGEYTVYCKASDMNWYGNYTMTLDYLDPPCAAAAVFRKWVPPADQWDNTETTIAVKNVFPMLGVQLGFWFDPRVVVPVDVLPGAGMPADAQISFDLDASLSTCANPPIDPAIHRAVTIGAIFSADGSVALDPGTYDLFIVKFAPAPGAPPRASTPLIFADCPGGNVYPPQTANVITNASGLSYVINEFFGTTITIGIQDDFSRGDTNGDRRWDISDVIIIFRCTFKGELCSSCPDTMDANDDGKVDIADGIYLINWRFKDGNPPPAPFPSCGQDPTDDSEPLSRAQCSYTNC